ATVLAEWAGLWTRAGWRWNIVCFLSEWPICANDGTARQPLDLFGKTDYFDLRRTIDPVVVPADDHVGLGGIVAVVLEAAAVPLEFDGQFFPCPAVVTPHDAIREVGADLLDIA